MRRLCQARLRQAGEQYVAETGRSTPTVQDVPQSGQLAVTPAFTASVLTRARRIRRQCRDRQAVEQNTAVALADGISGPPAPTAQPRPDIAVRDHNQPEPGNAVLAHAVTVRPAGNDACRAGTVQ